MIQLDLFAPRRCTSGRVNRLYDELPKPRGLWWDYARAYMVKRNCPVDCRCPLRTLMVIRDRRSA